MTVKDQDRLNRLPLRGLMAVVTLAVMSIASSAHAQAATGGSAAAPETRAQVKMELAEFRRTHTWDPLNETWVLKPGIEPPEGVKTRAQVRVERDDFLRKNRWDQLTETWIPLSGEPRDLSTLTRAQVKTETAQFMRTHVWDDETDGWVDKPVPSKKAKKSK